jgi:hypothetical protein
MTHMDAKAALARAETPADRKRAVITAMEAGMPLHEIEDFLDWTDATRQNPAPARMPRLRSLLYSFLRLCGRRPQQG